MDDKFLRITDKELFYSAMMLNLNCLVNVDYAFPADETRLTEELGDVKRSLHKKKLMRENSNGEITLDFALSACAAFCSAPESCVVIDEGGYYASVYSAADTYMLMERGEIENMAIWFAEKESLDGYVAMKLENAGKNRKGVEPDGGA